MQSLYLNQVFINVLWILTVHSLKVVDLNGKWIFQNTKLENKYIGTVPGGIYTDLMDNKVIKDVYYQDDDMQSRWVAKENWTYFKRFEVSKDLFNFDNMKLVFDGVDTFSSIFLNEEWIGDTKNMFLQYSFDIRDQIKIGENLLQVNFTSPITKANELANRYSNKISTPISPSMGEYNVNYVRKMQASFGWDWAPAFPSMGIWKSAYIEVFNQTILKDVIVNVTSEAGRNLWHVNITVYVEGIKVEKIDGNLVLQLRTDVDIVKRVYDISLSKEFDGEFKHSVAFTVAKSKVQLWWPNGYGNQKLYDLEVTFTSSKDKSMRKIKIGFRTVKVRSKSLLSDFSENTYFYIAVNNEPIFVKGSNVMPISILPENSQDISTIKFLLKSARDAHINMIRIWGSGIYQSNEFYDLADELGLLVWQDFMFACAMYPTNNDFLRNVKEEVRYQVKRLQWHPSIVLWSAVNENEVVLSNAWNVRTEDFYFNTTRFAKIYINTIESEVLKIDMTRKVITSFPRNDFTLVRNGYISRVPGICGGDAYFYNYISGSWDEKKYPIPMPPYPAEASLLSMPTMATLLTTTNITSDPTFGSSFLEHRRRFNKDSEEMLNMIITEFILPNTSSPNFYKAFVYYSQITQALVIKAHTEKYRIWRYNVNKSKEGFTMGSIYYQLNDVWAMPSLSGIDYKKNWKMLHYFTQKFNSPIIIVGQLNTTSWQCSIYIVSDIVKHIENATAILSVYRWKSVDVMYAKKYPTEVKPKQSILLAAVRLNNLMSLANCGGRTRSMLKCFVILSLRNENNQLIAPDNFLFPVHLKEIDMKTATVKILSVEHMDKQSKFKIELSTNEIALFVWLEVKGVLGTFSENGFVMHTKTKVVYFNSEGNTTETNIKSNLNVTHLKDPKYFSDV